METLLNSQLSIADLLVFIDKCIFNLIHGLDTLCQLTAIIRSSWSLVMTCQQMSDKLFNFSKFLLMAVSLAFFPSMPSFTLACFSNLKMSMIMFNDSCRCH